MKEPDKPKRAYKRRPPGTNRGGQPPFKPTAEQRSMVKMLAGLGVPQDGICSLVKKANGDPISHVTLTKYFRDELEDGLHEANAKVAKALFDQAVKGENVSAMIFWLKTRARWKEAATTLEHTGPDGKPLAVPSLADFYKTVAIFDGKTNSPKKNPEG